VLEEEAQAGDRQPLHTRVPFRARRELPPQDVTQVDLRFQPVDPDAGPDDRADAAPSQRPDPYAAAQSDMLARVGRIRVGPGVGKDVPGLAQLEVEPELHAAA